MPISPWTISRFALATLAIAGAITFATPADAKSKAKAGKAVATFVVKQVVSQAAKVDLKKATNTVASAARSCAASVCNVTPTGKAFSSAVKAWDRAGWNAGRYISVSTPGGDPGRYPGLMR